MLSINHRTLWQTIVAIIVHLDSLGRTVIGRKKVKVKVRVCVCGGGGGGGGGDTPTSHLSS